MVRGAVSIVCWQFHDLVILLAGSIVLLVRILLHLLPEVFLTHVEMGHPYPSDLPQRLKLVQLCPNLQSYPHMMRPQQQTILGQDQRPKFTVIILEDEFPALLPVLQDGMYPRYRDVLGDAHIHVLLPADVDLLLIAKGDELEDLTLLAASLPHHL